MKYLFKSPKHGLNDPTVLVHLAQGLAGMGREFVGYQITVMVFHNLYLVIYAFQLTCEAFCTVERMGIEGSFIKFSVTFTESSEGQENLVVREFRGRRFSRDDTLSDFVGCLG